MASIINFEKLFHLGFRCGPFLIVFYFIFQSILNWELRGVTYIVGLILTSVFIYLCNSPFISIFPTEIYNTVGKECHILSLGLDNNVLSVIPLSIAVYTYTFIYLLMFMVAVNGGGVSLNLKQNISILLLFPLFIFLESFYIIVNNCVSHPLYSILSSIIISSTTACIWGLFIISLKNDKLYYLNNMNSGDVCSRPAKMYLRCKKKQLI